MTNGDASHVNEDDREAELRQAQEELRRVEQAELALIGAQIETSQTFAEIMEVKAALRGRTQHHPEERARLSAVFKQLAMLEDSACEAQAEAKAMRLTPEECQQCEQLFALRRRVRAEDAPEVFAAALCTAREALASWEPIHPEARNCSTSAPN